MSGLSLPVYPVAWPQFCSVVDKHNMIHRQVWNDTLDVDTLQEEVTIDLSNKLVDVDLISNFQLEHTANVSRIELHWAGETVASWVNRHGASSLKLLSPHYWLPLFTIGDNEGLVMSFDFLDPSQAVPINVTAVVASFSHWRDLPLLLHAPIVLPTLDDSNILIFGGSVSLTSAIKPTFKFQQRFTMTHPIIRPPPSAFQCHCRATIVSTEWVQSIVNEMPIQLDEEPLVLEDRDQTLTLQFGLARKDIGQVACYLLQRPAVQAVEFIRLTNTAANREVRLEDNHQFQCEQYQRLANWFQWPPNVYDEEEEDAVFGQPSQYPLLSEDEEEEIFNEIVIPDLQDGTDLDDDAALEFIQTVPPEADDDDLEEDDSEDDSSDSDEEEEDESDNVQEEESDEDSDSEDSDCVKEEDHDPVDLVIALDSDLTDESDDTEVELDVDRVELEDTDDQDNQEEEYYPTEQEEAMAEQILEILDAEE